MYLGSQAVQYSTVPSTPVTPPTVSTPWAANFHVVMGAPIGRRLSLAPLKRLWLSA